jgi:hypothetical protein
MPDGVQSVDTGRFEGREAWRRLFEQHVRQAVAEGWADWWWVDADFADWPLGERWLVELLQAWARRGRRMRLLARHYRGVQQVHARFVGWRVTWDHLIEVRACPAASEDDFPSVLWSPRSALERVGAVRAVVLSQGPGPHHLGLHQELQEWWARSTPAFPASTLGL